MCTHASVLALGTTENANYDPTQSPYTFGFPKIPKRRVGSRQEEHARGCTRLQRVVEIQSPQTGAVGE